VEMPSGGRMCNGITHASKQSDGCGHPNQLRDPKHFKPKGSTQ